MRNEKLLRIARNLTNEVAQLSHCKRARVGSVLTDALFERIINFGYNGNFRGGPNTCDSDIVGGCGCVHAELNALIKQRFENPHTIICSLSPCAMCAKAIINAGIKRVICLQLYRDTQGLLILKSAGLETYLLQGDSECASI